MSDYFEDRYLQTITLNQLIELSELRELPNPDCL